MPLRDIALTVEERATNQFFWVLVEAADSDSPDAIHYRPLHCASAPQSSYSSALVFGVAALRRLVQAQAVRRSEPAG
ncbi:hypothetical protein [Variovorax sp. PBL-E5]|uniref:hypothetical protein n=1 Tax=Variovorax sp. PBL-E5 TaxID=434014 RepID=UPI00131993C5|nr:hypothetical protein [Variovorax sp. PBL-E5]VTU27590.1 hypothetical protein E5CHR_02435 [Variovorax sp. PBL-E5]